jgi:hypothetical protein
MLNFIKLTLPNGLFLYLNLTAIKSIIISDVDVSVDIGTNKFSLTKNEFEKKLLPYLNTTMLIKEN